MAQRRPKGNGGVRSYKRGRRTGWRAELSRTLPDGTAVRRSKVFHAPKHTKADAERWLREQLAALDAGQLPAGGTVGEWLDRWLPGHRQATSPATWGRDQEVVETHIRPRCGPWQLAAVTGRAVTGWLADLHAAGVSASERKRAAATLKKILRSHEQVPRSIWDTVKLPRHKPAETRHLSPAELEALIRAADARGGWLGAMVRVGIDGGLRAGELLGLQWGDYDPAAGRLLVRRAVCVRTGAIKDTKTDESRRDLVLSAETRAALDALPRGADGAAIFAPRGGRRSHYRYKDWSGRVWAPLLMAAGLSGKGIVPRSLRHTCASLLLAGGHNIRVVAARLGHTDPGLTLRIYSHLMADDQERAAVTLGRFLAGG